MTALPFLLSFVLLQAVLPVYRPYRQHHYHLPADTICQRGEECLLEIKKDVRLSSVPVIVYTTSRDVGESVRLKQLGAAGAGAGDPKRGISTIGR